MLERIKEFKKIKASLLPIIMHANTANEKKKKERLGLQSHIAFRKSIPAVMGIKY